MKKTAAVFLLACAGVLCSVTTWASDDTSTAMGVYYGGYCCDALMRKWCELDYAAPVGAACYCRGVPGIGTVCM